MSQRSPSYPQNFAASSRIVQVSDNLYELYRPLGTPRLQILFFHGLQQLGKDHSNPHLSTWQSGDGSCIWPQSWLVEEFPGAHVLSVSYIGYLVPSSDKDIDLEIIGVNVLSDLLLGNIGQVPYCPVVLVGHCIGGLVIKQLCCEADKSRQVWSQDFHKVKLERLFNNLRGMFYYATPHLGSPVVDQLGDIMDIPLLNYCKALNYGTAQLKSRFEKLSGLNKWLIAGMGETLPTKLVKGVIETVLVPEASARDGHIFKMVQEVDHFSISRPESKKSQSFSVLKDFLDHIARDTKEEGTVSQEENYQQIPKYAVGIDIQVKRIVGRLDEVTTVGLTGKRGIGKTTLAKALFNELGPDFEYSCFVSHVMLIEGDLETLKDEVWKQMHCLGKKIGKQPDWSLLEGEVLLLVLDDISTDRDEIFLSEIRNVVSAESRFILTSRDRELLCNMGNVYYVPILRNNCAEQLFMNHALPNSTIPSFLKFTRLIKGIVNHCEGLPLTIEALGTYLRTQENEEEWERTYHALDKAQALKQRLFYSALPANEQQVFEESTGGQQPFRKLQENDDMDEWFDDPITAEKMCDPVMCSDGRIYDRWTIVDHRMHKSPYDRNIAFVIFCDDFTTRSRLFRAFPKQELKFRERRKKYREKALQHASADPVEFEDAIEKLNNVLKWLPRDTECANKLAEILILLSKQSIPSQQSSLVSEQESLFDTVPRQQSSLGTEQQSLSDSVSSQQSSLGTEQQSLLDTIPVVMHEDVTRARLDREGARLATFLVLCYVAIMFYIG